MVSPAVVLKLALSTLWVNRFRSFLTLLGMLFGTASVIATLSSSEGAQRYLSTQLESLGNNVIAVVSDAGPVGEAELEIINAYLPEVSGGGVEIQVEEQSLSFEGKSLRVGVTGVSGKYFSVNRLELSRGRHFTAAESNASQPVVILGAKVAEFLFGVGPLVGEHVTLGSGNIKFPLLVTGALRGKGGAQGAALDNQIFISGEFASKIAPGKGSSRVLLNLTDDNLSREATLKIRSLLTPKYRDRISVSDSREAIEATRDIWEKQNLVGLSLAFVSLLTGGVGIMNIMLLSINQRRREIGLRKAVGAQNIEIAAQFLVEAALICFVGGAAGILVGWGFGKQVASMLGQWEAVTSLSAILLALFFATGTGVLFGLVPAVRASRIDPYDALRSY